MTRPTLDLLPPYFGRTYVYCGDRMTRPDLRGEQCVSLLQQADDGQHKCIRGKNGNMLVYFFKTKETHTVLARHLRRVALALLLLLLSVPCAAQDRVTAVALGAYASLSAVDLAQTQRALGTGRYIEANPAMAWATKPETMALLKVGSAAAITTMAWKIRKSKPKTALALAMGAAVIQGAVVMHNYRTVR